MEAEDAATVANYLGTNHTRIELQEEEICDDIANFVVALDQPSVDGLNSWVVARAAAQHVKVAISGTGGDELFSGYPWFHAMQRHQSRALSGTADRLERMVLQSGRWSRRVGHALLRGSLTGFAATFSQQYRHFDPASVATLMGISSKCAQIKDEADLLALDTLYRANPLDRTSAICLNSYTLNQLLRDVDTTTMSHSLELRVPFLDPDLAETGPLPTAIPPALEGRKQSIRPTVIWVWAPRKSCWMSPPTCCHDEVASRPKRGFSLPIDRWLRGKLKPLLLETAQNPSDHFAALIDNQANAQVIQRFFDGQSHWGRPWILMMLDRVV